MLTSLKQTLVKEGEKTLGKGTIQNEVDPCIDPFELSSVNLAVVVYVEIKERYIG